ncbi:MAG: type I-E CRISPR-associated protein Cas7/Cse4/CasC [Hydrogenophilales bacterium]|nr:type I-E CRISPR-associated protein Cas7/Cse4/CasC [Hydrogenophilales bacterium]
MFLQIHTLTSYAAALLNRDDAGLAKRIPFGNAERMRVSSQCLKKHWRDDLHRVLDLPGGIRSRMFFEREVLKRVLEAGVNEEQARKLVEALLKRLVQGGQDKTNPLRLNQPVLFGKPEADYLVSLVEACAKNGEDPVKTLDERLKGENGNLRALMKSAGQDDLYAGVEGAMFGRFVTSDILARSDAAVHVAHAFTVHPLSTEVDYFTVVDDLKEAYEDAGAAHAGDMELGAGLFYGYVVVDVPLLVSNLSGCDAKDWKSQPPETLKDARDVLERLIDAIATVSPGAKLGSTAPYARAACVLLETGNGQPRTLANAYLKALKLNGDPMQQAVNELGRHLGAIDGMYGQNEQRFVSSTQGTDELKGTPAAPLKESVAKAMDSLFGAA